jgi:hypothetical protein
MANNESVEESSPDDNGVIFSSSNISTLYSSPVYAENFRQEMLTSIHNYKPTSSYLSLSAKKLSVHSSSNSSSMNSHNKPLAESSQKRYVSATSLTFLEDDQALSNIIEKGRKKRREKNKTVNNNVLSGENNDISNGDMLMNDELESSNIKNTKNHSIVRFLDKDLKPVPTEDDFKDKNVYISSFKQSNSSSFPLDGTFNKDLDSSSFDILSDERASSSNSLNSLFINPNRKVWDRKKMKYVNANDVSTLGSLFIYFFIN